MDTESRLTSKEWQLIRTYLGFYEDLHFGRRKPTGRAQQHFIAVCAGKYPPKTVHEVAYAKWLAQQQEEADDDWQDDVEDDSWRDYEDELRLIREEAYLDARCYGASDETGWFYDGEDEPDVLAFGDGDWTGANDN